MATTGPIANDLAALRLERDTLKRENTVLKATNASLATEIRVLQSARDIALRTTVAQWPRRPQDS